MRASGQKFGKEISDVGAPNRSPGRAAGRRPVEPPERARMIQRTAAKDKERFTVRADARPVLVQAGTVPSNSRLLGLLHHLGAVLRQLTLQSFVRAVGCESR